MSVCCVWGVSLTHRMECLRGGKGKNLCSLVTWVGNHLHVERFLLEQHFTRKVLWKFTLFTNKDWVKPVPAYQVRWWLCCAINHCPGTASSMGLPMAARKKCVWTPMQVLSLLFQLFFGFFSYFWEHYRAQNFKCRVSGECPALGVEWCFALCLQSCSIAVCYLQVQCRLLKVHFEPSSGSWIFLHFFLIFFNEFLVLLNYTVRTVLS